MGSCDGLHEWKKQANWFMFCHFICECSSVNNPELLHSQPTIGYLIAYNRILIPIPTTQITREKVRVFFSD